MARHKLKMSTPAEVRAAITKIANMVLNEEVTTQQANCLVYCCNTQLSAIKTTEQERRLQELEELLEGSQNG